MTSTVRSSTPGSTGQHSSSKALSPGAFRLSRRFRYRPRTLRLPMPCCPPVPLSLQVSGVTAHRFEPRTPPHAANRKSMVDQSHVHCPHAPLRFRLPLPTTWDSTTGRELGP